MAREYCPKCQAVRNMQVSERREAETDPDGRTREVVTRTFHCETCNAFVRSETVSESGDR